VRFNSGPFHVKSALTQTVGYFLAFEIALSFWNIRPFHEISITLISEGQCHLIMFLLKRNPTGLPAGLPPENTTWWSSETSIIVKYSLLAVFIAVLLLWVVVGSAHARRRIARGQTPMRYHRWLVPREHRPVYWAGHSQYHYYNQSQPRRSRAPELAPAPPPEYNAADMPPVYQPPAKLPTTQTILPPSYAELHGESSVNSQRNV